MRKLAVYGHYDSRGGTSAYEVADFTDEARAKADVRYNEAFGMFPAVGGGWAFDGPDGEKIEWDPPSKEDWLGWATLDEAGLEAEGDLDDNGKTWVIAKGAQNDDFFSWEGVAELRLVKAQIPEAPDGWDDGQPDLPEGWGHPRWDDDAFSFLLCEA